MATTSGPAHAASRRALCRFVGLAASYVRSSYASAVYSFRLDDRGLVKIG